MLVIGAITACFTGLIALVQFDIKRVVAYSTLSQLGYMMVAQGASAYAAGMFHLTTHAFFKALLFLAAGSVIIALHHEQDMRRMGGLAKVPAIHLLDIAGRLPGADRVPGFRRLLLERCADRGRGPVRIAGAGFAEFCIVLGVFVTSLYTFRMFFLVFHGQERMDAEARSHLREPPWVVWLPLVLLAIPSAIVGWFATGPMVFGSFFGDSLFVRPEHDVLARLGEEWHGPFSFLVHGFQGLVLYLALGGAVLAWFLYLRRPDLPDQLREQFGALYRLLENKYYADWLAERVIPAAGRATGSLFWRVGDVTLIDGGLVNGSARVVGWGSALIRRLQTGFLYHYAFAMVIALALLAGWLLISAGRKLTVPEFGLLSVLIWLPILGGVLLLFVGNRLGSGHRWLALALAVLTFMLSLPLYAGFDGSTADMQFVERIPWIPAFRVEYFLGIDGLSIPLILLTTFLTPIVVIAGWEVVKLRPVQYFAAFLILEGLMIGVFSALDGLLFYVFWEAMLVPMFIIIGVWGGERRVYATVKFFLYTFLGSVFMLLALIYLYLQTGNYSILGFHSVPLSMAEQLPIFLAFLFAFAVKVPMWPVHTWLPDAHVEAPTGGSVILAAVLLKMGGYGFVRFSLPITPDASQTLALLMIGLSLMAVVYIGFVALAQQDMKKLIAYSSIAHMGFVTLGFFPGVGHPGPHRRCRRHRHGHHRRYGADGVARVCVGRAVPVRRCAL